MPVGEVLVPQNIADRTAAIAPVIDLTAPYHNRGQTEGVFDLVMDGENGPGYLQLNRAILSGGTTINYAPNPLIKGQQDVVKYGFSFASPYELALRMYEQSHNIDYRNRPFFPTTKTSNTIAGVIVVTLQRMEIDLKYFVAVERLRITLKEIVRYYFESHFKKNDEVRHIVSLPLITAMGVKMYHKNKLRSFFAYYAYRLDEKNVLYRHY